MQNIQGSRSSRCKAQGNVFCFNFHFQQDTVEVTESDHLCSAQGQVRKPLSTKSQTGRGDAEMDTNLFILLTRRLRVKVEHSEVGPTPLDSSFQSFLHNTALCLDI